MRTLAMMAAAALAAAAPGLAMTGCDAKIDAGGSGVDAGADDDPLSIPTDVTPGSLDEIQTTIFAKRCSGQPGLCHNGQFEPNLSTAALSYYNLVNRPAIETTEDAPRYRVAPGDPGDSRLIDKLRDRNGVATRMPLGANPLSDEEIAMVEAWIEDGARRSPDAEDAPVLNNPPAKPEVGVFDASGTRLDSAGGGVQIAVGQPFTLRQSTRDFETRDEDIPIALFALAYSDGRNAVLAPGAGDPGLGFATYDDDAPMGAGDLLDQRFDFTFPAQVGLIDDAGTIEMVPSAGKTFTGIALYTDGFPEGIAAFMIRPALITVVAP